MEAISKLFRSTKSSSKHFSKHLEKSKQLASKINSFSKLFRSTKNTFQALYKHLVHYQAVSKHLEQYQAVSNWKDKQAVSTYKHLASTWKQLERQASTSNHHQALLSTKQSLSKH